MTPGELPNISVAVQDYARVWAECTSKALEQVHGAPFTAAPQTPALSQAEWLKVASTDAVAEPPADSQPESSAGQSAVAEEIYVCLKVSGRLAGEQRFRLALTDGVRLAQLLMSESVDPSVPFTDGHMEALHELFRQFAGLAASACKAKYGGEVEFAVDTAEASSEFHSAGSAIREFTAANISPIRWSLLLDAKLQAALQSARDAQAAPASAPAAARRSEAAQPKAQPSAPPAATATELTSNAANLDLLLDVVLGATLRFGRKDMLLRDILELRPGSVVELNRRIQEPAELLVSGRVIARGEVVIVDGSYGLRITDITQPHQRLESVETGAGRA